MGREKSPESPVTEQYYELAHFPTLVERVMANQRKHQSIQDTLEALASEGYLAVKERK